MSMYECNFCGSDEGGFPEVIIFLNKDNNFDIPHQSYFEDLFDKLYNENNKNESPGEGIDHCKITALTWKDFYYELSKHELWFCTIKCARKYLKHRKPEWELNKK
jgi:hypothetical protein